MKVKKGMSVELHYTGKHENGDVFDSSIPRNETLKVKVGDGQVIKGFDDAIIGMKVGEKKTINIEPKDGYGEHIQEAVQEMQLVNLPKDVKVDDDLQGQGPKGPIAAKVVSIGEKTAMIDFNHPLSGKKLVFEVELISIND